MASSVPGLADLAEHCSQAAHSALPDCPKREAAQFWQSNGQSCPIPEHIKTLAYHPTAACQRRQSSSARPAPAPSERSEL